MLGLCKTLVERSSLQRHALIALQPVIFLFFQLWASILGPTAACEPSLAHNGSSMPVSTANLLTLLTAAEFESEKPNYRWHENELQLQLDLQASTLVASLMTKPELDEAD